MQRQDEVERAADLPLLVRRFADLHGAGRGLELTPEALGAMHRRLDVLVLSQGTVIYRRGEFDPVGFRKVVELNLNSLMDCSLRFRDMLRAARGALITVSSTAAYHATKGNPAYNASKTGVIGLTRTLAQAWAGEGIRVNGIAPGLVDTKLTRVTTGNPERLAASLRSGN